MYENCDIGHDLKMAFEDGYRAGLEAAQPKWISVEERLPEFNEEVLIHAVDRYGGSTFVVTCYTNRMYGYNITGWESPCHYFFDQYTITHWMPLLAPHKEGER